MPLINRVGGGSAELQSKTVKSTTSQQTITPDEGYDGISAITVSPIKLQSRTGTTAITPTESTQNITPSSLYDGLAKVTVNPIPDSYKYATATQDAKEWTPTTYDQYIDAGTYCSGQQTIKGDTNLAEENILNGETIFGVGGTALRTECHVVYTVNNTAFLQVKLRGKVNSGDVVHYFHAHRNAIGYVEDDVIYSVNYEYGGGYDSDNSITGYTRLFCGNRYPDNMLSYSDAALNLYADGTVYCNMGTTGGGDAGYIIPDAGEQWTVIVTYGKPFERNGDIEIIE